MKLFPKSAALVLLIVSSFGLASRANASTVLVTNEAGIINNGLLDWGVLGASFAVVSNPFTTAVPGIAGLNITGSQDPGTSFERRDQGNGWNGNFAPGEELLWTQAGNGPMVFDFNTAISGFGAQIEADNFGAFTARIEAFDAGSNSLGFFMLAGNSINSGDDSAIFIGILSNSADIRRIVIGTPITANTAEDFAITAPRIQATAGAAAVPEPASMLLLGTGLAGLAARRMRRKK